MRQLKCSNCGASLESGSNICPYCGARYEREEKLKQKDDSVRQESKKSVAPSMMSDEVLNSTLLSGSQFAIQGTQKFVAIFFSIIWMMSAFGVSLAGISSGGPIFPVIIGIMMGIFGFVMIISSIKGDSQSVKKQINLLCQNKEYEKAFSLIQKELVKNTNLISRENFLRQAILISYYKLNNVSDAEHYIAEIQDFQKVKDPQISKIARELGTSYSPQSTEE